MGQIKESSIKELNYSSADCQLLIREYTRLIYRITKEYEELVAENVELRNRLKQIDSHQITLVNVQENEDIDYSSDYLKLKVDKLKKASFLSLIKKFWITLHLYGWKSAVQKVSAKLRGKLL